MSLISVGQKALNSVTSVFRKPVKVMNNDVLQEQVSLAVKPDLFVSNVVPNKTTKIFSRIKQALQDTFSIIKPKKTTKTKNVITDKIKSEIDTLKTDAFNKAKVITKKSSDIFSPKILTKLSSLANNLFEGVKILEIKKYIDNVLKPMINKEKQVVNKKLLTLYNENKMEYQTRLKALKKAVLKYEDALKGENTATIKQAKAKLDDAKTYFSIAKEHYNKAKSLAMDLVE